MSVAKREYDVVVAIFGDAGVLRKRVIDPSVTEKSLQELVGKRINLDKYNLGLVNGKIILTKRMKSVSRGLLREVVVKMYPKMAPESNPKRIGLNKLTEVAVANSLLKSKESKSSPDDKLMISRKSRKTPTNFQRQVMRRVKKVADKVAESTARAYAN